MKKVFLVLAMVAMPVLLAQPAIAAEGDAPGAAVEASPLETPAQEPPAEAPKADPPATPPAAEEETPDPAAEEESSPPTPQAKQNDAADTEGVESLDVVEPAAAAAVDLDSKVGICHVPPGNPANAHTNSVSYNSIVKGQGHGSTAPPHSQDVIPAFDYLIGNVVTHYPGRNLDGVNPCDVIIAVPGFVDTEDPTLIPPTCLADGFVELPETVGVVYTLTPPNGPPGDVDVDATAAPNYTINANETIHWDFLVLEQLDGPGCDIGIPDSTSVDFCHATAAFDNPYVDPDSATAGVANGHDAQHNGPIFNGVDPGWGDIIEPYIFNGQQYDGQNWTAEGQAIFANDCNAVDEVVPVEPSATDPTCDVDGTLIVPADTGEITYSQEPAGTGPGEYVITATATQGNVIIGDTEFEITVLGQLSADVAACVTDESGVDPADEEAADDALLPDTGGSPLWMLVLAGVMMAAGSMLLMRRQPATSAPSAGPATFYTLVLPPAQPARAKRTHASTPHIGLMQEVRKVPASIRPLFRGGGH